jgi:mannan endo-1,4-beta-mannosidase
MGFDIQNECFVADTMYDDDDVGVNDRAGWVNGRCRHLREVLGWDNPIKVCSGGVGGDWAHNRNFAPYVLDSPNLDIISVHYYNQDGKEADHGWLDNTNGKLVHCEEFTQDPKDGKDQNALYQAATSAMNGMGVPWCVWQVLPRASCPEFDWSKEDDWYGIFIDDGNKDLRTNMAAAQQADAADGMNCKSSCPT